MWGYKVLGFILSIHKYQLRPSLRQHFKCENMAVNRTSSLHIIVQTHTKMYKIVSDGDTCESMECDCCFRQGNQGNSPKHKSLNKGFNEEVVTLRDPKWGRESHRNALGRGRDEAGILGTTRKDHKAWGVRKGLGGGRERLEKWVGPTYVTI